MHNPACTHGYVHRPDECRDAQNQPLKPIEEPVAPPAESENAQVAEEVAETGDEALNPPGGRRQHREGRRDQVAPHDRPGEVGPAWNRIQPGVPLHRLPPGRY